MYNKKLFNEYFIKKIFAWFFEINQGHRKLFCQEDSS